MARAEASVEELVGRIERGELRLPEMQRQYVWRSTRVRDLMDSLYRGYPSGAILVWETDEAVTEREFAVAQQKSPYASTQLLLDGQQRLTSLSAVIRGAPVRVRGRKRPIDLLFNLEHPDELTFVTEVNEEGEEDEDDSPDEDEADASPDEIAKRLDRMTFVVATKKLEQSPQWVRVSDVFKNEDTAPFLQRAGIESLSDPRFKRYSERLARLREIKKYVYRMDVLDRGLSYLEVTEIFVRVNSLGAKLRSSDLALAQITARWPGSLKEFLAFQTECEGKGYPLELGIHLKSLIAFATGQSRFHTVGSLSVGKLKEAWKESTSAMRMALNFLKSNVGIDSPALLASPFLLVTLAMYLSVRDQHLGAEEAKALRQWVLLANAKGRYSRGSSETVLDQDLSIVRQGKGVAELVERLRQQVGNLEVDPAELEGRNMRSALFKTMFLAFREDGAADWFTQLKIAFDHSGAQHKLQFHHVFAKALLKAGYTSREADDIANLAFIASRTNQKLSDKEPAAYFPNVRAKGGQHAFDAQCIPTDGDLLQLSAYKEFLAERRKRIAHRLNAFLGTTTSGGGTP